MAWREIGAENFKTGDCQKLRRLKKKVNVKNAFHPATFTLQNGAIIETIKFNQFLLERIDYV